MNKQKLLEALSQKTGMTKKETEKAVEAFKEVISETLSAGEKLQLVGFGTFTTVSRNARIARNPRTGEPVEVSASRIPVFKAGKALKDAINR